MNRQPEGQAPQKVKTLSSVILNAVVTKSQEIKDRSYQARFDLDLKAVGPITFGNSTTATGTNFVQPVQMPGFVYEPYNLNRVRNFLRTETITSSMFKYIESVKGEGAPATTDEGTLKGQFDRDFSAKVVNATKIAGFIHASDEILDDVEGMQSHLIQTGLDDLRDQEDSKLLYGAGTGNDIRGLFTAASALVTTGFSFTGAFEYHALALAINQLRKKNYAPNVIMVSNDDFIKMTLNTDTTGAFKFDPQTGLTFVMGIPLIVNSAVVAGQALVGDFNRAAVLYDYKNLSVEIARSGNDFENNMIKMVFEERVMLPILQPGALVRVNFTTAIPAITRA